MRQEMMRGHKNPDQLSKSTNKMLKYQSFSKSKII